MFVTNGFLFVTKVAGFTRNGNPVGTTVLRGVTTMNPVVTTIDAVVTTALVVATGGLIEGDPRSLNYLTNPKDLSMMGKIGLGGGDDGRSGRVFVGSSE
jgi:hypothetical protein